MNTELTPDTPLTEPVMGSLTSQFNAAKPSLGEVGKELVGRSRRLAGATDDYLRANAWQVLGATAAAGVVIGYLAHRR